ncbi:DUF4382 domain-containing protein [Hymenobacter elongatus]|uniref:DUF4382 domain-containing protein n=1 Tax=Hymenobacter elongatus TaxID=877208 RepID=A0A4Z0PGN5_9BACT|nr:DUF4382 domain-containing protein [Hymenobacter elongatus]TGE14256.1 DUF4382 domain-containing protein [Hymenobacter elongatus]
MKTHLLFVGLLLAGSVLTGCEDALQEVAVADQATATAAKPKPEEPGYQAVNIDVLRVEVSQDADEKTGHWVALADVQPGVRNLLNSGTINSPLFLTSGFQLGTVKQVRVVLGTNNTITLTDGSVVAMDTPSGQTSGLKVKVNARVHSRMQHAVMVSIDPEKQIVSRGNGSYGLKPVLDGDIQVTWGGDTEAKPQAVGNTLGQAR